MSTVGRLLLTAAFLLGSVLPRSALAEGQHIRIVLDTSQSMARTTTAPRGNDPRRLAVLSALLLYDLAQPNLSTGDTFRVIPFKRDWPKSQLGGPEPSGVGPILQPDVLGSSGDARRARSVLADALKKLDYNAQNTYFAPGLAAAAADLDKLDCSSARCVVVLLTDGLPEDATRDREAQRLRDDILPRLAKRGVMVYVLAFGPDIEDPGKKAKDFFRSILGIATPGKRGQLGQLLIDQTGDLLPKYMVQIFSETFGYETEGPRDLATRQDFVLANEDNQTSGVLVFHLDPRAPKWDLGAPPGSSHVPQPLWEGDVNGGASYSFRWFLRPKERASYGVESRGGGGPPSAMVLRPAKLDLLIRPRPPAKKLLALSGRRFPLEILVKPTYGTGAPAGITIEYNEAGEEQNGASGWKAFTWVKVPHSPKLPPRLLPQEAVFEVEVSFEPPPDGRDSYTGHLEVRAFRGQAPVVDRRNKEAFPVKVYPSVRVAALPDHLQIEPPALEKNQTGCASLRLVPDPKEPLPHPSNPKYKIRARIPALPASGALDGATFELDGKPVELETSPIPPTGDWYNGAERPVGEVFDPHELRFCVKAGKPALDAALDIPIVFSFAEDPYDEVPDIFERVTVKAVLVGPTAVARWGAWVFVGGGPLLLLLALYYLRHRPGLPDDLRAAVGPTGGPLTPQKLGEGSLARRLLGLVCERPVLSPGGGDILGWVRPVELELYLFRPEQGVVGATDPADRPEAAAPGEKGARIRIHRRYQVEKDGHRFDFRLEYDQ